MKYKILFLLLFCFILNASFSQVKTMGNISDEEWEIKSCSFDASAKALIIFDDGNVTIKDKVNDENFDKDCTLKTDLFEMTFSRRLRIKIFDTLGLKYNKLTFKLKTNNNLTDKLAVFTGVTSWRENDKKNKVKFNSGILVKEKDNDGNYIMTCTFPNILPGCIIDIKYIIISNNFDELPVWNFRDDIPTDYSVFRISTPDFFDYQKTCQILDLLKYDYSSAQKKYCVWFAATNLNFYYKDYEYHTNNVSYELRNVKGCSGFENNYQLRNSLKSNNIQNVYGKPGSIIVH